MERPDGLSERQILAAQALASGCSWRDAARRAKCSVEAIRGWRKQTDFNDAVWRYQQEIFQQTFGVVSAALPSAIQKLREIVEDNDPDVNVAVKVQAIKILIDASQKQYETRTIERRIEHLESYARATVVEAEPIREISQGETSG
jgi:transposase